MHRNFSISDLNGEFIQDAVEIKAIVNPTPSKSLRKHSLENALSAINIFESKLAIVIYDPQDNKFIAHFPRKMKWETSESECRKAINSFKILANSLRIMFPNRFNPNAPEFAIAMSTGDYPGVIFNECIQNQYSNCVSDEIGPILHFGSVFKRPIFPSIIAMPMPQNNHLSCFHKWVQQGQVCKFLLPRGPGNPKGLVFGETVRLQWDDLIPQVVWRGTDNHYLRQFQPLLRMPDFDRDVGSNTTSVTDNLTRVFKELIPRWKGVVLTAEAEREAENTSAIPWANIKFTKAVHKGKKVPPSELQYYQQFQEHGIPAVGESMSLETLASYKYHIDLGGAGGTTWSGTLEKLGLPGLLFHHETPTKDYLHDKMIPWVHYVPVEADLADLKDKYEWAENHPEFAKRISEQATALAKSFGTQEVFQDMFKQFFEQPLHDVLHAYQPLNESWRDVVERLEGEDLRPVINCKGSLHNACEELQDDVYYPAMDEPPRVTTE